MYRDSNGKLSTHSEWYVEEKKGLAQLHVFRVWVAIGLAFMAMFIVLAIVEN